jgi:predicted enzyme related to lactoylglutathione lyase
VARGEVRYLHIPATDPAASATFYQRVFGWTIRTRGDGSTAFDDTSGLVSGAWVTDRRPADEGVLVYIRVDDVAVTVDEIAVAGGEVVRPVTREGENLLYADFRDPGGNVLGIFQEGG